MRKISIVLLLMVLSLGPAFSQTQMDTPSGPPKVSAKSPKKSKTKKPKAAKKTKKAKKSPAKPRGKGKKDKGGSGAKLETEIDHKAVTFDLEGK